VAAARIVPALLAEWLAFPCGSSYVIDRWVTMSGLEFVQWRIIGSDASGRGNSRLLALGHRISAGTPAPAIVLFSNDPRRLRR
jgi:hypothetical protein